MTELETFKRRVGYHSGADQDAFTGNGARVVVQLQEQDSLALILDDAAVRVDVYRRPSQGGVAGLTAETAEEEYLRTIEVRIDDYQSRSLGKNDSDPVNRKPVGLTVETDVLPDDLWRYTDVTNATRWYRVVSVARTQSASSTVLEELDR